MVNILGYIKAKKENFRNRRADKRAWAMINNQKKLEEIKEERAFYESKAKLQQEEARLERLKSSTSKLKKLGDGLAKFHNKGQAHSGSKLGSINEGSKANFGGERNLDFGANNGSPFTASTRPLDLGGG